MGNSVPPLLGQAVASQILAALRLELVPKEACKVGDAHLLELNMSQAAEYYDVPSTVIPGRIRKAPAESALCLINRSTTH